MKVILKKSVRKLGRAGNVVSVKNGYGRNYLLPQGFAVRANDNNLALFEQQKQELELQNAKDVQTAKAVSVRLSNQKKIIFIVQAASDGKLFGSISTKDISNKLSDVLKYDINHSSVLLDKPIKFTGVYNTEISLHPDIHTNVLIVVAKTDSEAQDMLKEYQGDTKQDTEIQNNKKSSDSNSTDHQPQQ